MRKSRRRCEGRKEALSNSDPNKAFAIACYKL